MIDQIKDLGLKQLRIVDGPERGQLLVAHEEFLDGNDDGAVLKFTLSCNYEAKTNGDFLRKARQGAIRDTEFCQAYASPLPDIMYFEAKTQVDFQIKDLTRDKKVFLRTYQIKGSMHIATKHGVRVISHDKVYGYYAIDSRGESRGGSMHLINDASYEHSDFKAKLDRIFRERIREWCEVNDLMVIV